MGGIGSGRRRDLSISIADQVISIDVREWRKSGKLAPWGAFYLTWRHTATRVVMAHVSFQTRDDCVVATCLTPSQSSQNSCLVIRIVQTDCHLGGQRPWFVCPTAGCGKRCAKLYLTEDGLFNCRTCRRLVYASQSASPIISSMRRADKIREKLKWGPGILMPMGGRPKGMHRETYQRLSLAYFSAAELALTEMSQEYDALFNHVERISAGIATEPVNKRGTP